MSDPGYSFVPLPDDVRRVPRTLNHGRQMPGTLTLKLELKLLTVEPIHVGSGFKTLRGDRVVREAVTSCGQPCIPGSSLKGVLRSRYEAITRSCALFRLDDKPKKVRSTTFPGARAKLSRNALADPALAPCKASDRDVFCPACALFGSMSLRSRVGVADFLPSDALRFETAAMPRQFSPNLHHVGHFKVEEERGQTVLVVDDLHGRKFGAGHGPEAASHEPVDVIPNGTALHGSLWIRNCTLAETGGLCAALGIQPQTLMKVGGGKGHGFGGLYVTDVSMTPGASNPDTVPEISVMYQEFATSKDIWAQGLKALTSLYTLESSP